MRAHEFVNEVTIDNRTGAGSVPWNQEVDYRGLRVTMKPSTFLRLALPLTDQNNSRMERHIGTGGTIGAPFLDIVVPEAWQSGDFSEPAQVRGHDGRHRMQAISKLEGDAPVETHLFPKYLRNRDLTPEIVQRLQAGMVTQSGRYLPGPLFDADFEMVSRSSAELAEGVAEGSQQISEYRDRLFQYVKSLLPTWPDYVLKDWLVPNKGNFSNLPTDAVKNGIMEKVQGAGLTADSKWQLIPDMKFTMDMFDPKTKQLLVGRAGGSSDLGMGIPKDKERHATQAVLAQQQGGVRKEPVLLIKSSKGYELLEGWHRTIQHFAKYPDGYTGPAYVAVAQPGVAEGRENYNGESIKNEDAGGIDFDMQFDDDTGSFATVTARAQGRVLGSVKFFMDGNTLEADMVEVDERYRGQGIAAAMYDYAKSQGYTIEKSSDLTPDGDHFWNKNRGEEPVWEHGMAENFADGKGPGRPGDSQRHGIPKHATMAELEKASHAKGRKGQLARWQLNMRRGHKK